MSHWTSFLIFELLCSVLAAQRLSDFSTTRPVQPGSTLIIGFLGGVDNWNDPHRGVRKVALELRTAPGIYAETIANRHRRVAHEFIQRALDWNGNGKLDREECSTARIILYGQSLGAEGAIDFARELNQVGVPVLLTVQVDSVGLQVA